MINTWMLFVSIAFLKFIRNPRNCRATRTRCIGISALLIPCLACAVSFPPALQGHCARHVRIGGMANSSKEPHCARHQRSGCCWSSRAPYAEDTEERRKTCRCPGQTRVHFQRQISPVSWCCSAPGHFFLNVQCLPLHYGSMQW